MGKLADLIIVNEDPRLLEGVEEFSDVQKLFHVEETIKEGKVVYKR